MRARAAGLTHAGCVRPDNEDAVVLPGALILGPTDHAISVESVHPPAVFVVLDGLGGHGAGARAARMVGLCLLEHFRSTTNATDVGTVLEQANSELYLEMVRDSAVRGFGAVGAGLVVFDDVVVVFNVGDARVYEFSGSFAVQSTSDQRVAGTNRVTESFGGATTSHRLEPVLDERALDGSYRFLACTDGLWEIVPLEKMQARLMTEDPALAVTDLLEDALEAGAPDNVSALVVDVAP